MPFTGALDSVLEQHRTAREGILEANMNPAATVKALRAESAPADSKHPKQRLHVRSELCRRSCLCSPNLKLMLMQLAIKRVVSLLTASACVSEPVSSCQSPVGEHAYGGLDFVQDTRSTSMPEKTPADGEEAAMRSASVEVEGMTRATSIAESLTDGELTMIGVNPVSPGLTVAASCGSLQQAFTGNMLH